MGKKRLVKHKSPRVSKVKKETDSEASGLSPSRIKREREDPEDATFGDHSPKRIKALRDVADLNKILPLLRNESATVSRPRKIPQTAYRTTFPRVVPVPAVLAMSIFQVRLTVFKHLPVSSLLQFALVSKDWYDETRSVLEKFKTCAAFIPGHQPCIDLLSLNNEIPFMTRIPFNSLNLKVFRNHQPCVSNIKLFDAEKLLGNILALPLKSFEINKNRWMDSHCLASALLREAISGRFPSIERMILPLLPSMGSYTGEDGIFMKKSLPNLKYLECRVHGASSKPVYLATLRRVINLRGAPNNQKILTPLEVSSSKNELESMTVLQLMFITWLLLQPSTSVCPVGQRAHFFSLRRLEVLEPVGEMTIDRSWEVTVYQLLECSSSTLEHLSLANHELILSLDGIMKPFPSLKYFQISIASMTDQLPGILSRIRLGQLFPNLIGLRIFFKQLSAKQAADLETAGDKIQDFYNDDKNSQLWPPITRLEFHVSPAKSFSYGIFEHFAQKCPQITEFVYRGLGEKFLNYQIFACFPQLKRLKLIVTANHVANLDEFLCGLDTEDVKDLKELPVEKLKHCSVVPRRLSINNLTDLKNFKLVICGAEKLGDAQRRGKSVLSHVTGVLIFSRWPSLKAEINCHLDSMRHMPYQTLNHLSPFAKVNYIKRF